MILAGAGLFLFGLACVVYVTYRFLSLVLSMDMAMLREVKLSSRVMASPPVETGQEPIQSQLRSFIQSRMAPTDGDFVGQSDEEMFIREQAEELKDRGVLDATEIDLFVKEMAQKIAEEKTTG